MPAELPFDPQTGEIIEPVVPNLIEYSVTEIAHALKRTIEDRFGYVRVRGEISGYRGPHSSGHAYFALKDEGAKLDAVIWRGNFNKLRSKIQEGLEVVASGKLTSYPGKSAYQIVIENIEPAGAGALMALLEERKKKLAAEGLFDASRKRALPFLPQTIGVVTSPTGAVIRDILHRLNDRFPRHVVVWPVRVQGETAAAEVAAAIQGFNGLSQKPDLLIVARGGGSLEDLWPFNDETIVRAVAASAIPVISAVGHETDTTLIDLVADWRAPTPTAAAERAVPVRADLVVEVASLAARQRRAMTRVSSERQLRLQALVRALPKPQDVLAQAAQRLDNASARLPASLGANLQRHAIALARTAGRLSPRALAAALREERQKLAQAGERLRRALLVLLAQRKERYAGEAKLFAALNYKSVLQRGFAVVRDQVGRPLRLASQVKAGDSLAIEFVDGTVEAQAKKAPN